MSDAWRGVTPVQQQTSVVSMQFQQCVACGALLNDSGLWMHQQWHESLAPKEVTIPEFPRDVSDLMGHIDALYILLGEDPPFNVGDPRART